jgi:hypothetical protein
MKPAIRAPVWLLILQLLSANVSLICAESVEDLYKRIFGKAPKRVERKLDVFVELDNDVIGEFVALVDSLSNEAKFKSLDLYPRLTERLLERYQGTLDDLKNTEYIKSTDLEKLGYKIIFNNRLFYFVIKSPPTMRKRLRINISASREKYKSNKFIDVDSGVSGFLNIRPSLQYSGKQQTRSQLRLDGKFHFKKYVLGTSGEYNLKTPKLSSFSKMHISKPLDKDGSTLSFGNLPFSKNIEGLEPSFLGLSYVERVDHSGTESKKAVSQKLT